MTNVSRLDIMQYVISDCLRPKCHGSHQQKPNADFRYWHRIRSLTLGTSLTVGRWAIEVADKYPSARVIGMDLAPNQPTDVPRNCEFVIGDLTRDMDNYDDGSMDLVQSRYLFLGNLLIIGLFTRVSKRVNGRGTCEKYFEFSSREMVGHNVQRAECHILTVTLPLPTVFFRRLSSI